MASALMRLLRRFRYGKPVVVVSGLPRSGTSMAMRMLEAGGMAIVTDGLRAPDDDNPKGYFEDERVKSLHEQTDKSWLADARGKAVKVIAFLLRSLPSDHNYKVVFMQRDLREIVASQNKMLDHRGEAHPLPDDRALELLERDLADARFFLRRPQFDVLELRYADALADPAVQARRIARFLGTPLDVERMAQAVSPELYRNRATT
jgi:sulfotransferase family protein